LKVRVSPALAVVLIICALGIVKFGLLPGDLMSWSRSSVDRIASPLPDPSGPGIR
jgi:hypothetical protein